MPDTVITVSVAANIRAELARAGISARKAAELLGENRGWVHRRCAQRDPLPSTVDDLSRIAGVLGIPVSRLIEPVAANDRPPARSSA